jgi:hypothetical protein
MKQAILMILVFCAAQGVFAQPAKKDTIKKKDTVAKPAAPVKPVQEYQANPKQVYRVVMDLDVQDATALQLLLQEKLRHNAKLTSDDADNMATEGKFINDKIVTPQLEAQLQANFEKWKADTASSARRAPSPKEKGKKIKPKQ